MSDPFERDAQVAYGAAQVVAEGVRRVVARNPSPMTFTGTASYLVGGRDLAVIDPGPDDPAHRAALLAAAGDAPIRAVLVSHSHLDHSQGAAALARAAGAPVYAFGLHGEGGRAAMADLARAMPDLGGGEGADRGFRPDQRLAEGDVVEGADWRLTALHTPGHLSNHLAFALEGSGIVFTGDVVMGWSTTLVSPPDGDMRAFLDTLGRLRARGDRLYLPGHGGPVRDPAGMIDWQIAHRRQRETQILTALAEGGATPQALAARIYAGLDPALLPAAARNVLAHLLLLLEDSRASADAAGVFTLSR